jgi:hypothetical protein
LKLKSDQVEFEQIIKELEENVEGCINFSDPLLFEM